MDQCLPQVTLQQQSQRWFESCHLYHHIITISQVKQEKGVTPPSTNNVATSAASSVSHPMAAEALAAQANFEVIFSMIFHFDG